MGLTAVQADTLERLVAATKIRQPFLVFSSAGLLDDVLRRGLYSVEANRDGARRGARSAQGGHLRHQAGHRAERAPRRRAAVHAPREAGPGPRGRHRERRAVPEPGRVEHEGLPDDPRPRGRRRPLAPGHAGGHLLLARGRRGLHLPLEGARLRHRQGHLVRARPALEDPAQGAAPEAPGARS